MLFLNGRTRNHAISRGNTPERSFPQKMGHSCVIFGCLSIVIGLILIVVGVISELKKTIFIGIGIISLGVGFFLTTFVCFYGKLDTCYNNWAYRSRVLPNNVEAAPTTPVDAARKPTFVKTSDVTEKQTSIAPIDSQAPISIISEAGTRRVVTSSTAQLVASPTNSGKVT